jgi:hypothetical protein
MNYRDLLLTGKVLIIANLVKQVFNHRTTIHTKSFEAPLMTASFFSGGTKPIISFWKSQSTKTGCDDIPENGQQQKFRDTQRFYSDDGIFLNVGE